MGEPLATKATRHTVGAATQRVRRHHASVHEVDSAALPRQRLVAPIIVTNRGVTRRELWYLVDDKGDHHMGACRHHNYHAAMCVLAVPTVGVTPPERVQCCVNGGSYVGLNHPLAILQHVVGGLMVVRSSSQPQVHTQPIDWSRSRRRRLGDILSSSLIPIGRILQVCCNVCGGFTVIHVCGIGLALGNDCAVLPCLQMGMLHNMGMDVLISMHTI